MAKVDAVDERNRGKVFDKLMSAFSSEELQVMPESIKKGLFKGIDPATAGELGDEFDALGEKKKLKNYRDNGKHSTAGPKKRYGQSKKLGDGKYALVQVDFDNFEARVGDAELGEYFANESAEELLNNPKNSVEKAKAEAIIRKKNLVKVDGKWFQKTSSGQSSQYYNIPGTTLRLPRPTAS